MLLYSFFIYFLFIFYSFLIQLLIFYAHLFNERNTIFFLILFLFINYLSPSKFFHNFFIFLLFSIFYFSFFFVFFLGRAIWSPRVFGGIFHIIRRLVECQEFSDKCIASLIVNIGSY